MLRSRKLEAVLVGLVGLIWILISVREIRLASASTNWPKVEGTITSVSAKEVVRPQPFEKPQPAITKSMSFRISYEYSVNEIAYRGNRLFAGQYWLPISEFWTRDLMTRYRPGGKVQVAYDPTQPSESFLEPGFDGYFVLALVGGYFLLLVGILIVHARLKSAPA